jgi:hypothetical protein
MLAAEPPADLLHQDVSSGIQEHATAEGAAAAFDALGTDGVLVAASGVVPSQVTLGTPLGGAVPSVARHLRQRERCHRQQRRDLGPSRVAHSCGLG